MRHVDEKITNPEVVEHFSNGIWKDVFSGEQSIPDPTPLFVTAQVDPSGRTMCSAGSGSATTLRPMKEAYDKLHAELMDHQRIGGAATVDELLDVLELFGGSQQKR